MVYLEAKELVQVLSQDDYCWQELEWQQVYQLQKVRQEPIQMDQVQVYCKKMEKRVQKVELLH